MLFMIIMCACNAAIQDRINIAYLYCDFVLLINYIDIILMFYEPLSLN